MDWFYKKIDFVYDWRFFYEPKILATHNSSANRQPALVCGSHARQKT